MTIRVTPPRKRSGRNSRSSSRSGMCGVRGVGVSGVGVGRWDHTPLGEREAERPGRGKGAGILRSLAGVPDPDGLLHPCNELGVFGDLGVSVEALAHPFLEAHEGGRMDPANVVGAEKLDAHLGGLPLVRRVAALLFLRSGASRPVRVMS